VVREVSVVRGAMESAGLDWRGLLRMASPAEEGFRSVFIYPLVCANGELFSATRMVGESKSQRIGAIFCRIGSLSA
jgi:hypothetical protein